MKRRPTVLIVEPDKPEGLSARKLVLETGKFNVLTAHSVREAHVAVDDFSSVDALVLHWGVTAGSIQDLAEHAHRANRAVLFYGICVDGAKLRGLTVEEVAIDQPQQLLDKLVQRFGDPKKEVPSVVVSMRESKGK